MSHRLYVVLIADVGYETVMQDGSGVDPPVAHQ